MNEAINIFYVYTYFKSYCKSVYNIKKVTARVSIISKDLIFLPNTVQVTYWHQYRHEQQLTYHLI